METQASQDVTGTSEPSPDTECNGVSRAVERIKQGAKECLSDKTTRRGMLLGGGAAMAALFGKQAHSQSTTLEPQAKGSAKPAAEAPDQHGAPRGIPPCPPGPGDPQAEVKLLHKGTFGFTQAELTRVNSLGYANWLDEQLNPASMPDWVTFEADLATIQHPVHGYGPYLTLPMDPGGDLCDNDIYQAWEVRTQLVRACLIRAVYSPAQVFERAVMFWTDHINTHHQGSSALERIKTFEDRLVVRQHALGNFRDLIYASGTGPAMLIYLNGRENTKNSINENYAREIMELHTLGEGNCYDEDTIKELAKMLTGWNVDTNGVGECGVLYPWNNNRHNDDPKTLIFPCGGNPVQFDIPGGLGETEMGRVVDILTDPAEMGLLTAEYVGRKLCKFFSGYEPPQELVDAVVGAYVAYYPAGNNIKEMIRVILSSQWIDCGTPKVKRPIHMMASALRACEASVSDPGADNQTSRMVGGFLVPAGHVPYNWPTPDGFPDTAEYWSALLPRWNFGAKLADAASGYTGADLDTFVASLSGLDATQTIDALDSLLFGGYMSVDDRATILSFFGGAFGEAEQRLMIGMAIGCPSFQCY